LPSLLNNALLLLVSIFGLFHLLITHDLSTLQMVIFGISSALLLGVVVVLIYSMKHRSWLVGWVSKIRVFWAKLRHKEYEVDAGQVFLKQLYDAWDSLQKIGWRQPVLGSIMNIGFDLLTLFFLFVAAGHVVSPGILLAGYGLPLLLGKMTFLPGGVGIVESTMATLYNGLGVPSGVTVVVILAYRAVSFWLPTLIGFPLIPYFQHSS